MTCQAREKRNGVQGFDSFREQIGSDCAGRSEDAQRTIAWRFSGKKAEHSEKEQHFQGQCRQNNDKSSVRRENKQQDHYSPKDRFRCFSADQQERQSGNACKESRYRPLAGKESGKGDQEERQRRFGQWQRQGRRKQLSGQEQKR